MISTYKRLFIVPMKYVYIAWEIFEIICKLNSFYIIYLKYNKNKNIFELLLQNMKF